MTKEQLKQLGVSESDRTPGKFNFQGMYEIKIEPNDTVESVVMKIFWAGFNSGHIVGSANMLVLKS